jgi:hypothetical protein
MASPTRCRIPREYVEARAAAMPSESPTSTSRTSSSERVSACPPRAAKYSRFSTPERCPYSGTLLRQIADTPLRQDGLSDDVEALDARATCGRPQQPEEQGERRGLPRSVRAQEAIDLAEPSTSSTSARATT